MGVVKERYSKLRPKFSLLKDEVVLAQAWKKTHTFVRRHNWYADVLELDVSAVTLPRRLLEWSESIATGEYKTSPAWLVPAPKSGLWHFKALEEGSWGPRKPDSESSIVLRPLAHIGIKEQTVATAVMLCLADCIESAQGNTSLSPEDALDRNVFSYGNRLFCNWSKDNSRATFPWGNSDTYSRYFQDYQRFVERPLAIATKVKADGEDNIFIVSLDISAFFDNIDIDLLIRRMRDEYESFVDRENDAERSDARFWATACEALKFHWREDDEKLAGLFRGGRLPSGLPQGLVSSGFFANAYLLPFDRAIGKLIGKRPPRRNFRLHDYCRYVDDIRMVISVEPGEECALNHSELATVISIWVQKILKEYTTSSENPDSFLRVNPSKTQLEPLSEVGGESGTTQRMQALQQQLSGPFDLDALRQTEAGLNGLLSLAELGLIEDSSSSQTSLHLGLSSIAKLKLEVRDDTLTRFSAYRLVRSLKKRRSMTDLTDINSEENAKYDLEQDFQATARRLVAAWAANPSLVQILRFALDLYPSVELLKPIEDALLNKLEVHPFNTELERRVAFYVLADLFKAGATETGREAEQDSAFDIADIGEYREALSNLAKRVLDMDDVPWYVQQQGSLLLASVGEHTTLPDDRDGMDFHRLLHSFVKIRSSDADTSADEEISVSIIGHQLLQDVSHFEKWFIRFCEKWNRPQISKAWQIIAETAPDLFSALLVSKRKGMADWIAAVPRYLTKYLAERWSGGNQPLPTGTWLPLLTVITHPSHLFSQENSLLILARQLGKSNAIRDSDPALLTPLNVEIKSRNWIELNNPQIANLEVRVIETIKTGDGSYDTPSWCLSTDAWMYALGRLLRVAATGEPDFTTRHWLTREAPGWYSGLLSTWHKRRMGMLHTAEGLRGTAAAITPWFSDLLLQLLRWPGIAEKGGNSEIKTRNDFNEAIKNRIALQTEIFGRSSNLPVYRYPVAWPVDPSRGLRVAMIQGLMPLHADFGDKLDNLDKPGYREKHRNHTAALLHLANKHLAARDYVLGKSRKPHFDLVIFPELSIHIDDQDLMRAFSDATGAMLFYGLLAAKNPSSGAAINAARWLVPQRRAGARSWVQVDQGKYHLTQDEIDLGIQPWRPYQVVIELTNTSDSATKPYRLTGSICFDATDLALAADLRDESHMYIVAAMNKDVKTFDGMIAALRYHMYQHVLIANIGEFGGSTAQAPYDKEHRRLLSHSHGSHQLAISVFDINTEDFGPELKAKLVKTTTKEISERIGKTPPAGLNR